MVGRPGAMRADRTERLTVERAGGGLVDGALEAAASESGDGRDAQRLETVDHALEAVAILFRPAPAGQAIGERADMVARAEALSGPGQDEDPDRRIRIDAAEGLPQHLKVGG